MKFFFTVLTLVISLMTVSGSAQFIHPGVTFNTEDLERMRNNKDQEPWKTGYEIILANSKSSYDYQMKGPFEIVDRNGQNFQDYNDDADAVFFQSLQYYITGDERYAENAMEIIEAWASTNTHIGGNVPALSVADKGVRILTGAEILRYTYPGWTNELSRITEDYAREVLLPPLYLPDVTRFANQGAAQINGAIAIAAYLNDQELFDQVINAFLNEPCAGITNSTASGMNGDTGRDYGHAFGMVLNLALAAEGAIKQGVDLFSVLDNRILAMTEYWNAYGLGVDVPFTPYGTCYDYFETIGDRGRGFNDYNTNILLEIVAGAYTVRKGIPARYTTERINEIPISENTFLFKKDSSNDSGSSPGLPYAAHTGATDNNLTDVKIGTSNSTGSSSSNGNTWTIVGNGDVYGLKDADECQFAYQRLSTNGTIIGRVDGINSSNSNAKVGLMFRESLNDDSRMFAAYAHKAGGLETTFRNQSVVNTENVPASQANLRSFDDVRYEEGWIKIEVNENRVSGFYSIDQVIWVPLGTAIFNRLNEYYIGIFAGSSNNDNATGLFSDVEIFNDDESVEPTTDFMPIPALVQAEDFSSQSGTQNESTSDAGGGQNVGYIDAGDFLEYAISVPDTGQFDIDFRVASKSAGVSFDILQGNSKVGEISSGATGNWQNWETISTTVDLNEGDRTIRLLATGTGWNINYLDFKEVEEEPTIGENFVPAPNKTYYVDNPRHNLRLAATGQAEDAYTTSTSITGNDVEWQFVAKGNGSWHMQRADGGTKPRLRSDASENADMQETTSSGTHTYFNMESTGSGNTYFFTLPDGPEGFERLQINSNGDVKMVPAVFAGSWESFKITEAGTLSEEVSSIVQIVKRNAIGFAIDGNRGGADEQNIYLWDENENNVNQQWVEISRGEDYYSYQKQGTNFCIDGGNGGANRQNVSLYTCSSNNRNQHWQKVDAGGGAYKLVKRNASGYALDGGNGGNNAQNLRIYDSSVTSQNLHWFITPIGTSKTTFQGILEDDNISILPNPVVTDVIVRGAAKTVINIYNLNGRMVLKQHIPTDNESIDLNQLKPGLYFARVIGAEKSSTFKIVKN